MKKNDFKIGNQYIVKIKSDNCSIPSVDSVIEIIDYDEYNFYYSLVKGTIARFANDKCLFKFSKTCLFATTLKLFYKQKPKYEIWY